MVAAIEHAAGQVVHHRRLWSVGIFAGAAIALADVETDSEAQAFCCAARAVGVPVNVIDKPKFCQFQFGSIVNRSPVVVAISTDGAAPILAQAIRRRIETLLPPSLGTWGALAQTLRATVMARLAKGAPRRLFWERFSERAFGSAPTAGSAQAADTLITEVAASAPEQASGVTLVGAGPGDAELLTLKAVRALQSADVILFDDLVSAEVLELARRAAKRMLVGKRDRRDSCAQGDINALMVRPASQGHHVVRLKSGDPMIFGLAGEEITELELRGIAVDVVPGITAVLAMAASLGVSLTHRDCAQSVRLITGHARNGQLPADLDWQGLADPTATLVFYMGRGTAAAIAGHLMAARLGATTPVVLVAGGSRADEARWRGDLDAFSRSVAPGFTDQPVLIGIGQAFAARAVTPERRRSLVKTSCRTRHHVAAGL